MLLDTHQLDPYQGHGYHLPQDIKETPSGLGAFPAIFSFPGVSKSFLVCGTGIVHPQDIKETPSSLLGAL